MTRRLYLGRKIPTHLSDLNDTGTTQDCQLTPPLIAPDARTMAGRQRTFDLIPTTLVKSHGNQPIRMTSKQVKKAYQQANRKPRVSRAEQRRLDAAELERQKKEYEREKAAAKAKAAREKKAAKENAEKEARKKMGLPEPSRFVRASQPTISRFVKKGNNGKRSWQEIKMDTVVEDSDATLSDTEIRGKDEQQPPAKRIAIEEDSDDEFGEFPSLSQSDLLEKIDSSMVSVTDLGSGAGSSAVVANQPAEPPCRTASQELPARKLSEDESPLDDSQDFTEILNTQLLSEAASAAQRSDGAASRGLPILEQVSPRPIPPGFEEPKVKPIPKEVMHKPMPTKMPNPPASTPATNKDDRAKLPRPTMAPRPTLQEVSVNMPPPPIPFKEKKAISFAPSPQKHKLLPQNATKSNTAGYDTPSATQIFLENHLDDFFPSPSQAMRELISDAEDLPSNTQIARELSPELPAEKTTSLPSNRPITRALRLTPVIEEDGFDNLICTQDLILSSQELLEITTPSRAPPNPEAVPELVKEKPVSRPKARFFEEKEDDILRAVLDESKTTAARPQTQPPQARERKRPFFEEKEEDLLAAALDESKKMAEKQEAMKVPLKEMKGNRRKERTLKRGLSSASTDYGEDEFSGGEWESLGF